MKKLYVLFLGLTFILSSCQPQGGSNSNLPIISLTVLVLILCILISYLLTLKNTINAISQLNRNRANLSPNSVWGLCIPIINIWLNFTMVFKLTSALNAEFKDRNINGPSAPGFMVGMYYSICCAITFLMPFIIAYFFSNDSFSENYPSDTFVGKVSAAQVYLSTNLYYGLFSLLTFILWISYWVTISNCKRLLLQPINNLIQKDNYSDLEKLMELKNKGVITNDEFEQKKKQILKL